MEKGIKSSGYWFSQLVWIMLTRSDTKGTKGLEQSFICGARILKTFTVCKICLKSADVLVHFQSWFLFDKVGKHKL